MKMTNCALSWGLKIVNS